MSISVRECEVVSHIGLLSFWLPSHQLARVHEPSLSIQFFNHYLTAGEQIQLRNAQQSEMRQYSALFGVISPSMAKGS